MMWNGIGRAGTCIAGGGNMFLWIIVIAIIGWLVYTKTDIFNKNSNKSAIDTLNKRYVNGEITKEEFNEMKTELEKG